MELSWTETRSKFKLPLRVVGWCLWRSLQQRVRKCQRFKQERDEARREVVRQNVELTRQRQRLDELRNRLRKLEAENRWLRGPVSLAGRSAAGIAQVRFADDPFSDQSGKGSRFASVGVRVEDFLGVAGNPAATARLDNDSPLADAAWRREPGGAVGRGRRSGLDRRSFESDRAGKGVGGVGRACFAAAAAGRNPQT